MATFLHFYTFDATNAVRDQRYNNKRRRLKKLRKRYKREKRNFFEDITNLLAYLMIILLSIENASFGSPNIFQDLINTGSPRISRN